MRGIGDPQVTPPDSYWNTGSPHQYLCETCGFRFESESRCYHCPNCDSDDITEE